MRFKGSGHRIPQSKNCLVGSGRAGEDETQLASVPL